MSGVARQLAVSRALIRDKQQVRIRDEQACRHQRRPARSKRERKPVDADPRAEDRKECDQDRRKRPALDLAKQRAGSRSGEGTQEP